MPSPDTQISTTPESVSADWKVNLSLFQFDLILGTMHKTFAERVWTEGKLVLGVRTSNTTQPQYLTEFHLPTLGALWKNSTHTVWEPAGLHLT